MLALLVVLLCRLWLGDATFRAWGWRLPFLFSALLLLLAMYIRMRLAEAPLFARLKEQGKSSQHPLKESLGSGRNWKMILLALLGATSGQATVWYTGQFYALIFLQTQVFPKTDFIGPSVTVTVAIALATPLFLVFGGLSDQIGRKKVIMTGLLLAAVTYLPIYHAMKANAGNMPVLVLLVFIQVIYVTLVYGPIAAFLVEYFPARIRYTSMSLPYHMGNGWFGGSRRSSRRRSQWPPTTSTPVSGGRSARRCCRLSSAASSCRRRTRRGSGTRWAASRCPRARLREASSRAAARSCPARRRHFRAGARRAPARAINTDGAAGGDRPMFVTNDGVRIHYEIEGAGP